MPLNPGTRVGPYEIFAPIGAGGMGEVYRAHDTRLGRDVALKVLPTEVAADPSRRSRFEQEARAVAALNHPNIVAVYDVGDGYMVSELVDGETLRSAKFGLRKTLDIGAQIASGLAAAHAAGIVHRDLKPDNVLITKDGRAKILDFGLARMRNSQSSAAKETMPVRTEPGVVMGTAGYMSPEQVRGLEADHSRREDQSGPSRPGAATRPGSAAATGWCGTRRMAGWSLAARRVRRSACLMFLPAAGPNAPFRSTAPRPCLIFTFRPAPYGATARCS